MKKIFQNSLRSQTTTTSWTLNIMHQMPKQKNHSNRWPLSTILIKIQPHVHLSSLQSTDSKEVFHKVSQAYDTLSDPQKRNAYDQKQSFLKKPKQESDFKEPTMFFYRSSGPFYSDFEHEFRWSTSDYAKKKAAQERMDDRARHEREKFKKQHNQKNKNNFKEYANPFFKEDNFGNNKGPHEEKSFPKEQEKDNPKKQENFFRFQKVPFKKQNYNCFEYEVYRNKKERKARLQKQRNKANKNLWVFLAFIGIVILWVSLDFYGPVMRGVPVYSIIQSGTHKIPQFTKELNSPFYVTQDYIERAKADDRFREYIDRKIDFSYIKLISRLCNSAKKKEEQLNDHLSIAKSIKSRTQITEKLKQLDFETCTKVHHIRQKNPIYFKALFVDPRNEL